MTCKLMGATRPAGAGVLLGRRRVHRVEGLRAAKKGQPRYPYSTMKELLAHAAQNRLSIAQVAMAERGGGLRQVEAEINAFIDKITTAMTNIVKTGLSMPVSVLPGRSS